MHNVLVSFEVSRIARLLFAILWALVVSFSAGAAERTLLDRYCPDKGILAFGAANNPDYKPSCTLSMTGTIAVGDAARIERLVKESDFFVETLMMNSLGGDALEALAIADLINKYGIKFRVLGTCSTEEDCKQYPLANTCASACGLVYVLAHRRERVGSTARVLLHRPYFERGGYAKLDTTTAQALYAAASTRVVDKLRAAGVSEEIISRMLDTSSERAFELPIEYPSRSPWLEEWVIARCGPGLSDSEASAFIDLVTKNESGVVLSSAEAGIFNGLSNRFLSRGSCEEKQLESESRRLQGK